MVEAILYSFIAGVLGTVVGGVISLIIGSKHSVNTNIIIAIASGFMVAISCFELIPESIESGGLWVCLLGLCTGVIALALIDILTKHQHGGDSNGADVGELKLSTAENVKEKNSRIGIIVFLAIALHNLPEGMAIGSKEVVGSSIAMTILISLHNIPEGMAMATPLLAAGMKKWKVLLYVIASGLPTVLGAIIGASLGGINAYFNSMCMALAAGAMLYVVVFELYRECYKEEKHINFVALGNLVGIILGMVAIVVLE